MGNINGTTNFFVDNYNVYHRIRPANGSIKFHWQYSITLKLLPQYEYILMMFDPGYVIPSNNPELVPRTSVIVRPNSIGNLYLKVIIYLNLEYSKRYFIMQVIKRILLKTEENPCESTVNYNVLSCVEKKLISETKCRPPWINSTSTVRMCSYEDDSSSLRTFMELMSDVTFMGTQRLYSKYGCLRPCTYLEYKVNKLPKLFSYIMYQNYAMQQYPACRGSTDVEV